MLYFLWKLAVLWLRRHLQTLSGHVEQPAMIGTAQAAVFDVAVFQRCAPMWTVKPEQADFAELIAKQDQIFAPHVDRLGHIVKFARDADDHPVAPKPFPASRARSDMRDIRDRRRLGFPLSTHVRH